MSPQWCLCQRTYIPSEPEQILEKMLRKRPCGLIRPIYSALFFSVLPIIGIPLDSVTAKGVLISESILTLVPLPTKGVKSRP